MSSRHASCLILEYVPAVNLDDLSNEYSGSFQAASAKYWHTTSPDLRARRCKGSLFGRDTENDVDISWRSGLPRYLWMGCPWPNERLSDRLVSAPSHLLFTTLLSTVSSYGVAIFMLLRVPNTQPFLQWSFSVKKLLKIWGWPASSLPLEFLPSEDTVKLYLSVIHQMHLMAKFGYVSSHSANGNASASVQNLVDNEESRDQSIINWPDK